MLLEITDNDLKRADAQISTLIPNVSRSLIKNLIDKGLVTVDGCEIKPDSHLSTGTVVKVNYDFQFKPNETHKIEIIYEDEDCLVIIKPNGMLTHSKGAQNDEQTVASSITKHLAKDMTGNRAGIVHRLDRDTSGVMICAKNKVSLKWLQKQFANRRVKKTYLAVVAGVPNPTKAIIDMPIARDQSHKQRFKVDSAGRPAITEYEVLSHTHNSSLVNLRPKTGRTHQLRVHLKKIGHPIIGDKFYSGRAYKRLMLHALSLEITLPNKQRRVFEAPIDNSEWALSD
jgi:23S rRNA pseudouridine1911/1915/1917 synthase